jgi:hypothetical protein
LTWDNLKEHGGDDEPQVDEFHDTISSRPERNVNFAANKPDAIMVTPSPRKTARSRRTAASVPSLRDGTHDGDKTEDEAMTKIESSPKRKASPRKAAARESMADQPQRKLPPRRATGMLLSQGSFVYYDDDVDDSESSSIYQSESTGMKRAMTRALTKHQGRSQQSGTRSPDEEIDESESCSEAKPAKRRKRGPPKHPSMASRTGRWSLEEELLFLHGLKACGKGKWKEIGEQVLRTR